MDLMQWLNDSSVGEMVFTALVSMLPVVELRLGLPFGVGLGLPYWTAFVASVLGNMVPVPFIIVYIRRIFQWLRHRSPGLDELVTRLETRAHLKGRMVTKYKYVGLCILVAIPLPGTGAWTGALVAAFFDMPLRKALPTIFLGVLLAGCAMIMLTFLGVNLFSLG